jgi:RcsF protein
MHKSTIGLACLFILSTATLVGCSGRYAFDSNIKGDNFTEYFSANEVKIFSHEKEFTAPHQYVGIVEGDDCQTKVHLASPDKVNARTAARKAAYKQEANAIVFTSCVDIESQQCVAQIVCYGKAYKVGEQTK